MMWGKGIRNPGRVLDDFVTFIDMAPTFLEIAGIREEESGMQAIQGKSLLKLFRSGRNGRVDSGRDHVLEGTFTTGL